MTLPSPESNWERWWVFFRQRLRCQLPKRLWQPAGKRWLFCRRRKTINLLNFNWTAFDPKGAFKYTVGVAIVIAASLVIEFPWFACGTSALLVWLTNVPGPRSAQLKGMAIYISLGALLVGLGYVLAGTIWPWVISMLVVAFIAISMRERLSQMFAKQVKWVLEMCQVNWTLRQVLTS